MLHLICGHKTHDRARGFPSISKIGWIMLLFQLLGLRKAYVVSSCRGKTNLQRSNDSTTFPASCSVFNLCYWSWDRPAGNVYCSSSIDSISYLSLLLIKNTNEIPLNQFHHLIFDLLQTWQREMIYLCSIVYITNDLFDYFYQLRLWWVTVKRGVPWWIVLTI